MHEKMPERIWAWITQESIKMEANARRLPSDPYSTLNHEKAGRWTSIESGKKKDSYLRSTPTLEMAEEMRKACEYLMSFVPKWAKEVTRGLCPTMYGTGTFEGDAKVLCEVQEISNLLATIKAEEEGKNE